MTKLEKSIDVHCPLRAVYNQWSQFEDLPEFVSSVTEVHQIDDTHVHCHAEIRGKATELDAEIIDRVPNEHIAWKSLSGTPSVGVLHFEPLGPRMTRLRLMVAYEPAGAGDGTQEAVESLSARLQDTIENFKLFIENRSR
jgi:uncharacterized membrane protein